jgi:pilus assembly protein CpaC
LPAFAVAVNVPLNGSKLIRLKAPAGQVSVSAAKIVDIKLLGDEELLVTGKALGQATVTVWGKDKSATTYAVQVVLPVEGVVAKLQAVLPGESVNVEAVGNTVVLTGQVSEPLAAERAQRVVEAHVKSVGQEAQVLNFLTVKGRQQVQLRVKIAEVSRNTLREVGMNAMFRTEKRSGGITAPGVKLDDKLAPDLGAGQDGLQPNTPQENGANKAGWTSPVPLLAAPLASDAFGLLFTNGGTSSFPLSIAVSLLQQKGLAKVLSEPTLVSYSGQKAEFLSGGEIPIPIPTTFGQPAVQFKKFGVQLSFTPTVMGNGNIHLQVAVAVSDRDQSSIDVGGIKVSGLATRSAETAVRLKSGQSFAIAGLLQDRIENTTSRVPLLGDIPILGLLFRKDSARRQESELVILVTAHLVQPLGFGEVPALPGEDEISDPGSVDFFLMGSIETSQKREIHRAPAGPVGFSQ